MSNLISVIQQIAQEAIKSASLTDVVFGTLTKNGVKLEQNSMDIPKEAVITSEIAKLTNISVGSKVLMLRCSGGQKFVILSKVE